MNCNDPVFVELNVFVLGGSLGRSLRLIPSCISFIHSSKRQYTFCQIANSVAKVSI